MYNFYVRIYPPFSDIVGDRQIILKLESKEIKFVDAVKKLVDLYPKMNEIFPVALSKENIYGVCFPVINGKLIRLEDNIKSGDIIEIYGSIYGG
jgi:molybdopterin converting factor small subunit